MLAGRGGYDTSPEAFSLRRALAALPREYAEPLLLQVIGGYTAEEVAALLELTPSAVNTRLFRARSKLRKALIGTDSDIPANFRADHELS